MERLREDLYHFKFAYSPDAISPSYILLCVLFMDVYARVTKLREQNLFCLINCIQLYRVRNSVLCMYYFIDKKGENRCVIIKI